MADDDNDGHRLLYHTNVEVSVRRPLSDLRQIAVDAAPTSPAALLRAQQRLLRSATARLRRKGLSTDTETYRRLGILIAPWKYPEQFEVVLCALREYWRRHRTARSLGRAAPYREVRERATEYLRRLAEEEEDGEAEEDNDNDHNNNDHLLPSATMVRVFRLVNGNLEIPPTLFKVLVSAGRMPDAFFPDEPDTWQRPYPSAAAGDGDGDGGGGGGGGGGSLGPDDDDARSVSSYTDVSDASDLGGIDRGSSSDDPIFADELPEMMGLRSSNSSSSSRLALAMAHLSGRLHEAASQFMQQLAGRQSHRGGSGSGGGFDIDMAALPPMLVEMLRGNNNNSSNSIPPSIILCPIPVPVASPGKRPDMASWFQQMFAAAGRSSSGSSSGSSSRVRELPAAGPSGSSRSSSSSSRSSSHSSNHSSSTSKSPSRRLLGSGHHQHHHHRTPLPSHQPSGSLGASSSSSSSSSALGKRVRGGTEWRTRKKSRYDVDENGDEDDSPGLFRA